MGNFNLWKKKTIKLFKWTEHYVETIQLAEMLICQNLISLSYKMLTGSHTYSTIEKQYKLMAYIGTSF